MSEEGSINKQNGYVLVESAINNLKEEHKYVLLQLRGVKFLSLKFLPPVALLKQKTLHPVCLAPTQI